MTDRCSVPGCRAETDLIYLDHGICTHHWNQLTADDASPDSLRMVLGIETSASATKEEPMSETTTAAEAAAKETVMPKKTAKKKTGANVKKAKTPRELKVKKERKPKEEQPKRVFAFRLDDAELEAIHRTAGPRNASRFVRAVAAAFAAEDEGAFRAVLKDAREHRA